MERVVGGIKCTRGVLHLKLGWLVGTQDCRAWGCIGGSHVFSFDFIWFCGRQRGMVDLGCICWMVCSFSLFSISRNKGACTCPCSAAPLPIFWGDTMWTPGWQGIPHGGRGRKVSGVHRYIRVITCALGVCRLWTEVRQGVLMVEGCSTQCQNLLFKRATGLPKRIHFVSNGVVSVIFPSVTSLSQANMFSCFMGLFLVYLKEG